MNLNVSLQIYLQGNESKFDRIVDVNFSIESVHVHHLVRDMPYRLQMAAYNRMGEGVKSEPLILGENKFTFLFLEINYMLWAVLNM